MKPDSARPNQVGRSRSPNAAAKADAAREKLLQAGDVLFNERELGQVSVDEITNAAGVAHGLLFHYFKSKMAFYAEVSRRAAQRLALVHQERRPEPTADAKLAACLSRHMDVIIQRPASYKFHVRGSISNEVRAIWEASRHEFILLVLRDMYGVPNPKPHLVAAVRAWLGFFDEMVLAWIDDRKIKKSGIIMLSVQLFLDVLKHASILDESEADDTEAS